MIEIIEYADLIGIPFVDGGRTREGLDCWAVVLECYRRAGVLLKDPFASKRQADILPMQGEDVDRWIAEQFDHWERIDTPGIGSVVAFRDVDGAAVHVGVVVEPGKFLHALKRTGVVVGKLDREPWCTAMMGAYAYRG